MHQRCGILWLLLSVGACGNPAPASPAPGSGGVGGQLTGSAGQVGGALVSAGTGTAVEVGGTGSSGTGSSGAGEGGSGAGAIAQAGAPPRAIMPGHGPGTISELGLEAKDRPVQSGRFSLYVPDGIGQLEGVIVHQHGCGRDGIGVPHDLQWQALANRWGMALIGTELVTVFPDGDHCDRWSHIDNGSADLFVRALAELGTSTGHAELSTVPWVLWGHSGGATWVFQLSKQYPQKTAAVVIKSICEVDPAFAPALLEIPILLATGPQDLGQCYPITTQIFDTYRAAGAPWAYVNEPEGTHDTAQLRLLAIPYLDAAIAARVQNAPRGMLAKVAEASGALASNTSLTVTPADAFPEDPRMASWLPSATVGKAWHAFVTTRTVVDDSPPTQAPTKLEARLQNGQVTLTWVATADLESGVAAFKIYRDGILALTLPADQKRFQGWNYGDEPEPAMPALSTVDHTPGLVYRVSLVNGAGLESPQSEPVTAR